MPKKKKKKSWNGYMWASLPLTTINNERNVFLSGPDCLVPEQYHEPYNAEEFSVQLVRVTIKEISPKKKQELLKEIHDANEDGY